MTDNRPPALEAATEALLEQKPVSADVFASLTPVERAEMRSLARTAALLQSGLGFEPPAPESERKALEQAQDALAKSPKAVPTLKAKPVPWWQFWRKS